MAVNHNPQLSPAASCAFDLLTQNTKKCDYWDLNNFPIIDPTSNKFFAIHINIRSLHKNFDDLHHFVSELKLQPTLICLSETRLKESSNMGILKIEGYKLVHANSTTNAGGVAVYVSDYLDMELANQYNIDCPGCEELWIKVRLKTNFIFLTCVVYKHPKTSKDIFIDYLNRSLAKVNHEKLNCVVMGDINIL